MLGSGNWGCAIAKIIARNALRRTEFQKDVAMWVYEEACLLYFNELLFVCSDRLCYELGLAVLHAADDSRCESSNKETVDGRKLTDIINEEHENVKYLPGVELPHNLPPGGSSQRAFVSSRVLAESGPRHAESDVKACVRDAHILVFVLPHQFLPGLLKSIKGAVLADAVGVSLVKGSLCASIKRSSEAPTKPSQSHSKSPSITSHDKSEAFRNLLRRSRDWS